MSSDGLRYFMARIYNYQFFTSVIKVLNTECELYFYDDKSRTKYCARFVPIFCKYDVQEANNIICNMDVVT